MYLNLISRPVELSVVCVCPDTMIRKWVVSCLEKLKRSYLNSD